MKFKKSKNVNTIEYYAQCICGLASCSCGCECTCYSSHHSQMEFNSNDNSETSGVYAGSAYAEELAYK